MPSRSQPNLYELLGVPKDASSDDISRAYRRQARTTHPDVGGTSALFALIQNAHAVLSDPVQRAEYDRTLNAPATPTSDADIAALLLEQERALRQRWVAEQADWPRRAAEAAEPAPGRLPPAAPTEGPAPDHRRWIRIVRAKAYACAGAAAATFYLLRATGAIEQLGSTSATHLTAKLLHGFHPVVLALFLAAGVAVEHYTAIGVRIRCVESAPVRRRIAALVVAGVCLAEYLTTPAGVTLMAACAVAMHLPLVTPAPLKTRIRRRIDHVLGVFTLRRVRSRR